jgi:hypothetical protein
MKTCTSFEQETIPIHASLRPMKVAAYGNESAGFLQTTPLSAAMTGGHPGNLLIGSDLIREGQLIVLVAYFSSTKTFQAGQLERFIPPALAKI